VRARLLIWAAMLATSLLVPSVGFAYPRDNASVVEVEVFSREDVHRLDELGLDIMSVRDGVVEIAAIPEEIDVLWANGYSPTIVLANMRDAVKSLALADRGEYHSYGELTSDMAAWASTYSDITELVSIGTSVLGRDIWAIKITDNPEVEEAEPEIQWIGAHHGDETISSEVCYCMAEYLLENYGSDPQVTWLVNEREIWIIPMFNPDGFEAGSRYNGNGTDLNRNYLCPCGCNGGSSFSEPETQALRSFDIGRNPVTSLTFHSGAVYVNYLWDYSYDPTPDEPMIITISNAYGALSGLPVTNGADWYVAHGTCQDWCYDTRGEIDTTIEVSVTKDPPASQIDPIVADNIPAMLYQARMSGRGIRGVVTDALTGDPVSATISVPEIGKDVYTDPDVGDYQRMVESGTYTVVCTSEGFQSQTTYNVSASLDTFVVVDFQLQGAPRGSIGGYVYDENLDPIPALVEVTDIGGYSGTADSATGYYEILYIPVGDHGLRVSHPGHRTEERQNVTVTEGATSSESFVLASPMFFDDFESGSGGWVGDWALTTSESHSPSASITDSPGGDYGNGAYTEIALSSPVDLSGRSEATLSFWHRYDTEAAYDFCYVSVSTDGGSNWTQVASYNGAQSSWVEEEIDLTPYVGTSQLKVRFVLDSDGWITGDGWYLDDVRIFGDLSLSGVEDELTVRKASVANYPNPFNPRTTIRYQIPKRGSVVVSIYDAAGRLVRTLVDSASREAGPHEVSWDGTDENRLDVAAGIYFVRVKAAGEEASGKMVLLK